MDMNIDVTNYRLRFALGHLAISAITVSAFISFVMLVWYPAPLGRLEGVFAILILLVVVDVCLGPLLTLVVASPTKSRRSLYRDLAIIGLAQAAALGYGAYSTFIARPAFIVFNADRFDIVTPSELVWDAGAEVGESDISQVSFTGPKWVHALPPDSVEVRNRLLFQAVGGGPDLKQYPQYYRKWPGDPELVRSRMKGLDALEAELRGSARNHLVEVLKEAGLRNEDVSYVPILGRQGTGIALLKRTDLSLVAAMNIDPSY